MSGPHCPLRYKLLVRTVGKMQQRVDVLQLKMGNEAATRAIWRLYMK